MRSCGGSARALAPGDVLLLGADLVKPERDAAARLRRSARRDRGVQPEPARSHQPRAGRQLRSRRVRASRGLERRRAAGRDAPGERARPASCRMRGRRSRGASFARDEWIWTESSYKYDAASDRRDGRATPASCREQWIDDDAGFALTLFSAEPRYPGFQLVQLPSSSSFQLPSLAAALSIRV